MRLLAASLANPIRSAKLKCEAVSTAMWSRLGADGLAPQHGTLCFDPSRWIIGTQIYVANSNSKVDSKLKQAASRRTSCLPTWLADPIECT